jgi:hypothetical protein
MNDEVKAFVFTSSFIVPTSSFIVPASSFDAFEEGHQFGGVEGLPVFPEDVIGLEIAGREFHHAGFCAALGVKRASRLNLLISPSPS